MHGTSAVCLTGVVSDRIATLPSCLVDEQLSGAIVTFASASVSACNSRIRRVSRDDKGRVPKAE